LEVGPGSGEAGKGPDEIPAVLTEAGTSAETGALLLWTGGEMSPELREVVGGRALGALPLDCVDMNCFMAQPSEDIPAAGAELVRGIRAGRARFVLALPPTGSFSRLRNLNGRGPKPVRSQEFPRGLPWLAEGAGEKCARENAVIALCCQACEAAAGRAGSCFALVHPEYLGAAEHGSPPSFWDLAPVRQLGQAPGVTNGAFYFCQAESGAGSPMPTRVLTNAEALAR